MPGVTVRNISPEIHRALKARAAEHGRSTEAEIRFILEAAVRPKEAVGLGTELAAIGREFGITSEFDNLRDHSLPEPAIFE